MTKKTAYTLAKMWSEWSSRSWIGMRSATVMEVAEFLDALKDAGMKVERISGHALEWDAEAITEGCETEETAVPHESSTSRYDISIVEADEYPVRRSVRIATITFHYTPRSIRNEKVTVYEIDRIGSGFSWKCQILRCISIRRLPTGRFCSAQKPAENRRHSTHTASN